MSGQMRRIPESRNSVTPIVSKSIQHLLRFLRRKKSRFNRPKVKPLTQFAADPVYLSPFLIAFSEIKNPISE